MSRSPEAVELGFNTIRPDQNGGYFSDDIWKYIFVKNVLYRLSQLSRTSKGSQPIWDLDEYVSTKDLLKCNRISEYQEIFRGLENLMTTIFKSQIYNEK